MCMRGRFNEAQKYEQMVLIIKEKENKYPTVKFNSRLLTVLTKLKVDSLTSIGLRKF